MRPTLLLLLPTALAFSPRRLLWPRAEEGEKTTLNDINTLCTINFFSEPDAIICVKEGASMTFTTKTTTYLRNKDDTMCCEADNVCMLSNHTEPRVACYDPKDKFASIANDNGPCELNAAGDGCEWTGISRGRSFSTQGVIKVTAVKDGKAADVGVSGGGGGGSSGAGGLQACVVGIFVLVGGVAALLV